MAFEKVQKLHPAVIQQKDFRKFIVFFAIAAFGIFPFSAFPQENPENNDSVQFMIEQSTPLTIDLERQDSLKNFTHRKKKKPRHNFFYGYKSKRGFTKSGFGDNAVVEIFYYLKKWVEPNPYVPEIYWYDFRRKRIRTSGTIDKKYGRILNGPYKKIEGNQLLEQGQFYVGTKNGRWVTLNRNDILIDKKKYYHGWPKESMVKYYDQKRKKLKEVLPVVNGVVQGDYYYFFENGQVAVKGHYENGVKTGTWTEFYDKRRREKKQIQYQTDPYQKNFTPYTLREWDASGKLIYQSSKATPDNNY